MVSPKFMPSRPKGKVPFSATGLKKKTAKKATKKVAPKNVAPVIKAGLPPSFKPGGSK